jgi:hypothetical protein
MMTSSKITTPIVELNNDEFVLCKRVPNCFHFDITQPTPGKVMVGCLDKKRYFGISSPNWRYRQIDCQTGETLTSFEYDNAISAKDFQYKWKTQYFYDGMNGFSIIGEERPRTPNSELELGQTVIYYEVKGTTYLAKGRLLLDAGILPSQVNIMYDREYQKLNLVVVLGETLKWHAFHWDMINAGNPLTMADAELTCETQVSHWLGSDSISPNGNSVLVYNSDGDYCQILCLRTGLMDAWRFDAHQALFGTHTISWLDGEKPRITINCYSGQLVFCLTTGKSEFIKQSIQTVSVRVANWKYSYSPNKTRTINGLQWRMPSGVRGQPHRTFELDGILFKDEYDTRYGKTNKSIPRGNIGLDSVLMFENDFVAVFLIGSRTVIGFDKGVRSLPNKQLLVQPVIYQLSEKFKNCTICAITQDRIYAYLMDEDDYEDYGYYGYYGDFNIFNFPYQFTNQVSSLARLAKITGIPICAERIIHGFLAQQKKD